MPRHFVRRGLLLLALSLSGCATVTSDHLGAGETLRTSDLPYCDTVAANAKCVARPAGEKAAAQARHGITYFLPRQLVRVTASRTGGPVADAVKALVKARTDLETAEAAVKATKVAIQKTENETIAGSGGEAAKPILANRLTELRAELKTNEETVAKKKKDVEQAEQKLRDLSAALAAADAAEAQAEEQAAAQALAAAQAAAKADPQSPKLAAAQAALERAKAAALQTAAASQRLSQAAAARRPPPPKGAAAAATPPAAPANVYSVSLKLEVLPPSPDPAQAFILDPRHTIVRDDEHKISVSAAGLLTSANIVAADRTGDIAIEIAAFAGGIKGPPVLGVTRDKRAAGAEKTCKGSPPDFIGVVDFVNPRSVARLNDDLQCLGVRLAPSGTVWPDSTRPSPTGATLYPAIEGIVYRRPVDIEVRVEKCLQPQGACASDDPNWFPAEVLAVSLPQAGPMAYVRQDAGFLTRTKYDTAFKDGILLDYAATRPAELYEAVRIPMRGINAAFDNASKIISLRTGLNTNRAALTDSERAILESDIAYRAAEIGGGTTLNEAQLKQLESLYALERGALAGDTALSAARAALLRQQQATRLVPLQGRTDVLAARLALLDQDTALQAGRVSRETQLANARRLALEAQLAETLGGDSAATQLAASHYARLKADFEYQERLETLQKCVLEKQQTGQTLEACLAAP